MVSFELSSSGLSAYTVRQIQKMFVIYKDQFYMKKKKNWGSFLQFLLKYLQILVAL